MLHVRVSWVRLGGKVFLLIIFHLKMCIYIFLFSLASHLFNVYFSHLYDSHQANKSQKKCHLYVCHILRRCGSFFVLFGLFFFFCFARDKCEWNDEFYSYIQTHEIISIYNFFFAYNITSCSVVSPLFCRATNIQLNGWCSVSKCFIFYHTFFCNVFLSVLQCNEEEKMRFKFAVEEKKIAAFRQWFRVKCAVIQEHTEQ